MSKKFMSWKTKGMNRDLSVTAFNPEFAFENRNLRLSTNEFNTLLSWVNEKGTKEIGLYQDIYWYDKITEEKLYQQPENVNILVGRYQPIKDDPDHYRDIETGEIKEGEPPIGAMVKRFKYVEVPFEEGEGGLIGYPIGTAVLNHQLIVFTTLPESGNQRQQDYIFRLTYGDVAKEKMICQMLFGKDGVSLGFSVEHPLETLVSYESESIQKIYWTDGLNQPRVINIAGKINQNADAASQFDFVPELDLLEEVTVEKMLGANGMFAPGVIQYAFTYYKKNGQETNIFYTTPLHYISYRDRGASPEDKVENAFRITVTNPDTHFDYLRIYSIQRTSINGTPIVKRIQDISLADLNIDEPESYVCSPSTPHAYKNGVEISGSAYTANIDVFGVTTRCKAYPYAMVDYVIEDNYRVTYGPKTTNSSVLWITDSQITAEGHYGYFIFQSSNSTGTIKQDISVSITSNPKISYIDTGTNGDTVDPVELLYKGGETVTAQTIEQKDGTLFLGNISLGRDSLKDKEKSVKNTTSISQSIRRFKATLSSPDSSTTYYKYASQLTSYLDGSSNSKISVPCGGFKTNDYYRLGLQFQHKSGKWSEPIFLNDYQVTNRPSYDKANSIVTVPTIKGDIGAGKEGQQLLADLKKAGYLKLRPVVVFPKLQDRNVLCQGVANPTMWTNKHRSTKKDLYAQSSWFFRPSNGGYLDTTSGAVSPFSGGRNSDILPYTESNVKPESDTYNPDGSTEQSTNKHYNTIREVEVQGNFEGDNRFALDFQFVTLNSPDLEFDDQMQLADFTNTQFQQIGRAEFTCTMSDIDIQTVTPTVSSNGSGFVHQAFSMEGSRSTYGIVSGLFYDDFVVEDWDSYAGDKYVLMAEREMQASAKWMVYLWNKNGALNNDINRPAGKGNMSAELKKKIISNLRYAETNIYDEPKAVKTYAFTPQLFSSAQNTILKFGNNIYRGNIDSLLIPDKSEGQFFSVGGSKMEEAVSVNFNSIGSWWKTYCPYPSKSEEEAQAGLYHRMSNNWTRPDGDGQSVGNQYVDLTLKKEGVRMKYKSTPHLAFKTNSLGDIKWNDSTQTNTIYSLPILEIIQEPTQRFGGTSIDALKENTWVPCGEPVRLDKTVDVPATWIDPDTGEMIDVIEGHVEFEYSYGDTYFQRWDCLKTYAFTPEDPNQVIEIGSFMLESRTNMDGRYDRNRGQSSNLYMSPQNFNLINPVYSQIDNFFSYKILDEDYYKDTSFPNQVTWSKNKQTGADVDLWTNVTMASTMELDGDKGSINKITRLNDQLICFQDTGISQILYNENTQISTEQGVPVEIANSGKVQGKRYLSTTVGCSNKWSIVTTPAGIYFMDSNEKSIYLFNGQLNNISTAKGFNTYCKYCIPSSSVKWNPSFPKGGEKFSPFVTYYDKMNQDVLFITDNTALAFSEKLDAFTSFYDYGSASFFCNLDDTGVWIKDATIWKHQAGEYCRFFGVNKPYSTILIANQEPQVSKIYTNLEFRASVDNDMWYDEETKKYYPYLPFDSLEVWDEYQHGIGYLKNGKDVRPSSHHTYDNNASLNRKFRIWRTDVPRDNAGNEDVFDETFDRTFHIIGRLKKHPMDRMRNPWLYLRLRKNPEEENQYYADLDVEAINDRIPGTVKIGDIDEQTQVAYTRETANEHNSKIEGAVMYGAQRYTSRTELQDVMMTYFD